MPLPFKTGDVVDERYKIKRMIARAERTAVYEAQQLFTRRSVAIKVCMSSHADAQASLVTEARLLTDIRHPYVVEVLDAGETSGLLDRTFVVMELVEGRSLAALLATRSKHAVDRVVALGVSLCDALACIHASNVIHHDITPANIFLPELRRQRRTGWQGQAPAPIKLLGFGLAADVLTGSADFSKDDGFAPYRAPELLRGETPDQSSDVYALAMVLFECLTAELPFVGPREKVLARMTSNPPMPSPSDLNMVVPLPLGEAVRQGLHLERSRRFSTALAFGRALLEAAEKAPPSSSPPSTFRRRKDLRAVFMTPIAITRADHTIIQAHCQDISARRHARGGPRHAR